MFFVNFFLFVLLPPPKEGGYVIASVRLSVCLYVCPFVRLLTASREKYFVDFHEISTKCSLSEKEERVLF